MQTDQIETAIRVLAGRECRMGRCHDADLLRVEIGNIFAEKLAGSLVEILAKTNDFTRIETLCS